MFAIVVITKSGSTFSMCGGFNTRQAAATYAAAALRGELCCRRSRIKGYTIVNAADQRAYREANITAVAGRC